jgi:hypothetical protein
VSRTSESVELWHSFVVDFAGPNRGSIEELERTRLDMGRKAKIAIANKSDSQEQEAVAANNKELRTLAESRSLQYLPEHLEGGGVYGDDRLCIM